MTTSATGAAGSGGPGTLLGGRYRLEDLLSDSGGGRFWRGTDTVLGRSVAIHAVAADDERAPGLLRAARVSATVSDSRLLRVLDCAEEDRTCWVVNEWGDGLSLDRILDRDVLSPVRAAWLVHEVAETVANAHRQGQYHGRLNPEAVLVTHAGAVKLIGFAVDAALAPPADATGRSGPDPQRRDVLDLGGLLYAALVGRWPGVSRSAVPAAPRDVRGPLRPRQVRAGVPRLLDAVCVRTLREEGHDHLLPIGTAQEVAAALEDFVGDPVVNAPGDVASMYVEPTVALERMPRHEPLVDPEATMAGQPPASPAQREEEDREPVPELPPFVDSPERPLFASTEPRARPPTPAPAPPPTAPPRLPPPGTQWPLDEEQYPPAPPPWRKWAFLAAGLVLLGLAMLVAFNLGNHGGSSTPPEGSPSPSTGSTEPGHAITPAAVSDFDPEANPPRENPEMVPLATDGKADTGWMTMTYRGNSHLGGLKSGVGLLFDLGADRSVGSVEVTFTGTPTTFAAYAAPAGTTAAPTGLSGLREVGHLVADRSTATLRFDRTVTTRYLVIWLTDLPPVSKGHYRAQVDEVSVLS